MTELGFGMGKTSVKDFMNCNFKLIPDFMDTLYYPIGIICKFLYDWLVMDCEISGSHGGEYEDDLSFGMLHSPVL
jgi:hypothetical protein